MKKISLDLTTLDGNAYALMAGFSKQAKREHWTKPEIDAVIKEATTSDYEHLVATLIKYTR